MCGIAGMVCLTSAGKINQKQLEDMIHRLHHRGPDGYGFYHDAQVGFAHARLSIIDLTTGDQPIHNETRSIYTIFNGEIFNYLELRRELERQGHHFYTQSDTEVIVHLYEQYGDDFVQYLNGQFAIALWDKPRQRLLLVRDRIGIVPLFYTRTTDQLQFASEIKSLVQASEHSPRLNLTALDQLMTFWAPVSPQTVFQDVLELPPGQMLVAEAGQVQVKRYWQWQYPDRAGVIADANVDELAGELHDLLVDATRLRLRADVPVGAYLSGGLDSSVITAIIHQHGGVPLRTFSIGFDDADLDESGYQQELIAHLEADHSRIQCGYADIAEQFLSTIWHTESPILRTAPIPMGMLSSLVRQQDYKVVLTGEGSDEVLGGYDIFKEGKIRQFWARFPDSQVRPLLLKKLYPYLDISRKQGLAYLKSFFGIGLEHPELPYFSHLTRWATTARTKEFFSDEVKAQLADDVIDSITPLLPQDIHDWHAFHQAQFIESKLLMSGYLLCSQGDRMLMRNSVEGRFPFLDHRVIEFANRLHPKYKMQGLNEKYLLKKAMAPYLPASIVQRYKQPYRAPDIPSFFHDKTPEIINELISTESLNRYGYFDATRVARLVNKIKQGRAIGYKDNMAFVGILSTQAWHHLFIENFYRQD
ncbi:MAG: asparagine synthase (glutamine-hydrolyzing) [Gammaproteobacteria bacterium]